VVDVGGSRHRRRRGRTCAWSRGMTGTFRLAAGLAVAVCISAQGIGNLPSVPGCNLGTLGARVTSLNVVCCGSGPVCNCTIPCSTELLPLLDSCRPLLDVLLDADDGVRVRDTPVAQLRGISRNSNDQKLKEKLT
jgi:hypothetical protein